MAIIEDTRTLVNQCTSTLSGGEDTLVSALIGPDHPAFEALAQAELEFFPDMICLPKGNFAFWTVLRGAEAVHAMRLSFPTVANGLFAPNLAHEIVQSGQLTAQALAADFAQRGWDLSQFISVESSFRVAHPSAESAALPGYLGLTHFLAQRKRSGVLAHQNAAAEKSFRRAGLAVEPFSREFDVRTPSLADPSIPDENYWPVILPVEGRNREIMESLPQFRPEHREVFIDLRPSSEELASNPTTAPQRIRA